MEIKAFLTALVQQANKAGVFPETTLGALDKSCCPASKTSVIDFDKAGEEIAVFTNTRKFGKTCDALKLMHSQKEMHFLEMKGMAKYLTYQFDTQDAAAWQVEGQINKFSLTAKIADSLGQLLKMMESKAFNFSSEHYTALKQTPIHFIIVTDISPRQNGRQAIMASLDLLAQSKLSPEEEIYYIMDQAVGKTHIPQHYNVLPAKLMACEEIDPFYNAAGINHPKIT